MKLVRLGRLRWEILAVCDPEGHCQVLDFLTRVRPEHATHAIEKTTTRVPDEEIERAILTRTHYLIAARADGITIVDMEDLDAND